MPYLNQWTALSPNARVNAGAKIYATTVVSDKGTVGASTSTITFTNLQVHVEGQEYLATKSLNVASLGLVEGKQYVVAAVPQYAEPANQTAAETANLDYYVNQLPNGEALAYRFFPSDVTAILEASGGISQIKKRMFDGSATSTEIGAYNAYYEQIEKMNDGKYVTKPLLPTGYDLVLGELIYQDSAAKENVLLGYTRPQFKSLQARLGEIESFRKVMLAADADTAYGSRLWAIKSATSYTSLANAQTNTNGTDVTDAIKAADAAGTTYTFGAVAYVINEYSVAGTNDIGQTFKGYSVVKWLDRQHSTLLGRINPIFLDNKSLTGTVRLQQDKASRLTQFAAPASLVRFTLGASNAVNNIVADYDMGI